MIGRRRRERERAARLADLDAANIDIEPTVRQLEEAIKRYDKVRDRLLRILRTPGAVN